MNSSVSASPPFPLPELDAGGALERFAAAIVHEANNALGIVGGAVEIAVSQHPRDPWLERALDGVGRMKLLAAELRRYSRGTSEASPLRFAPCDLAMLVRAAMIESRRALPADLEQTLTSNMTTATIRGDAIEVAELVGILLANARDAVSEQYGTSCGAGRITVRLDHWDGGGYILSVADNGAGVPAEALRHVFEPFFTTKEPRPGRGLGLASALAIVRDHGGSIDLQSTPGAGCTVRAWFPPAPEGADC